MVSWIIPTPPSTFHVVYGWLLYQITRLVNYHTIKVMKHLLSAIAKNKQAWSLFRTVIQDSNFAKHFARTLDSCYSQEGFLKQNLPYSHVGNATKTRGLI